ncbi:unnamed protein product [Urochloa humidicola]
MSTGRGRGFDSTREEANGRSRDHPAPRIRVAGHETPRRSASATATRPPGSASALAVRPQPRHAAPRAGCWSRRPTCGIYSAFPAASTSPVGAPRREGLELARARMQSHCSSSALRT